MERRKLPIFDDFPLRRPLWALPVVELVYGAEIPSWCGLPYPGHPRGCPNYGLRPGKCPPQAPFVTDVFDLSRPMFLVHGDFPLSDHVDRMRSAHPEWTDRQCRCVLYWQTRSKAHMRSRAEVAVELTGADTVHTMAEATGVHLYATALRSGLRLEKIRNITVCRHIALVGWRP